MAARSDVLLIALVLLAVFAALLAPIAGRSGWPALATGLLVVAAGAGVVSFALALAATLRAGRRPPRAGRGVEES